MITLRGVSQCGKSAKVKAIADWILVNYPSVINHGIDLRNSDIYGVLEINKFKIALVSAGDDLSCVMESDSLIKKYSDIDFIINTCRTRGITRKHLQNNYNFSTGWLVRNIFVERFNPTNNILEAFRDSQIMAELKAWLTGLEKF